TPPPDAPAAPASALAFAPSKTPANPAPTTIKAIPSASAVATSTPTAKPQAAPALKSQPAPVPEVKLAQIAEPVSRQKVVQPAPAVEPAQPSDWHRSWGKAVSDAKAKPVPVVELPHADASRPD